jgi:dTDP-4-amino-4,6-dideoxygalactose transaminase
MIIPFIDLKAQYIRIKSEIDQKLQTVLEDGQYVRGSMVTAFEHQFGELHGGRYCIGVGNGTDAIFIALKCLGIGRGDEVITAANGCFPIAEAILNTGAKPVFVDADPETMTLSPSELLKKAGPVTKAIIPVHMYGQMASMDEVMEIAGSLNIPVLEDCSHAHFAEYQGKRSGTFGDLASFSFYPSKPIGAYGDAGCIITDDEKLAERIRKYANHGAIQRDDHDLVGVNSRMDELQAAILRVKLEYGIQWRTERNRASAIYSKLLKNIPDIITPFVRPGDQHAFHLYVIQCRTESERDPLIEYLQNQGIQTHIHYPYTLPCLKMFGGSDPDQYPVSFQLQNNIISLPMYAELEEDQIRFVCEKIRDFFN